MRPWCVIALIGKTLDQGVLSSVSRVSSLLSCTLPLYMLQAVSFSGPPHRGVRDEETDYMQDGRWVRSFWGVPTLVSKRERDKLADGATMAGTLYRFRNMF
jgi:hypothetical protein